MLSADSPFGRDSRMLMGSGHGFVRQVQGALVCEAVVLGFRV